MKLIGSPNEHNTKLARIRDRLGKDLIIAKKPLPGGDYLFEAHHKTISIEVKWSIGDLLQSLQVKGEDSGPRLAVEVRKMIDFADIPILVVPAIRTRGDGKVIRDDGEITGWEYNSVKGILTDVALFGCIVDEYDGDIAQRIAQLFYVISAEEHGWIQQRGRPNFIALDPTYVEAVWALASFQHIGPVEAQALLDEFGSVAAVAGKTAQQLQAVHGIGPVRAESLYGGLHHHA